MNGPFQGESAENYYRWELTDTFGGEANYNWVRRGLIHSTKGKPDETWLQTKARICKAARKAAGLAGVKSDRTDFGDMVRYDQRGTVLFVEFGECWIPGTLDEVAAAKAEATEG